MKKETKFVIAILILSLIALAIAVFAGRANDAAGKTVNAKVRYFDGTGEMIPLKSFHYINGTTVKLVTLAGDVMYIGTNNVIIIQEDAAQ